MPRYRKLPIEIDAWPCSDIIAAFKRDYWRGLPEPIKTENDTNGNWTVTTRHAPDGEGIYIPTLEGAMFARPGDWIIRGLANEFYPCKPAVFAATYEPVADPDADPTPAADLRGGFWPEMTGGLCSVCHIATIRGGTPTPDCADCAATTTQEHLTATDTPTPDANDDADRIRIDPEPDRDDQVLLTIPFARQWRSQHGTLEIDLDRDRLPDLFTAVASFIPREDGGHLRQHVYDLLNVDGNFAGCPDTTADAVMTVVQPTLVRLRTERDQTLNRLSATLGELEAARTERDGVYRERAQLLAWLAAIRPACLAPAEDVAEPGWHILYLYLQGYDRQQVSWHIAPGDLPLFDHVQRVPADDPRARWDGHTTPEKYARIRQRVDRLASTRPAGLDQLLTHVADNLPEPRCRAGQNGEECPDGAHPGLSYPFICPGPVAPEQS